MNLVIRQKPDFFLFENVKGLWRTKKHREFYEKIKNEVQRSGYITTEKLVNAIEYGVPQDRERILLLGFKRELLDRLGYKIPKDKKELPEGVFPWKKHALHEKDDVFSLPWEQITDYSEGNHSKYPGGAIKELTVEYWFKKNSVYNHSNSRHVFKPKAGLKKFTSVREGDVSKKSYKRLHRWRYSPTAAYGNNEVHIHPYYPRRISVAEALAIQSLPKRFELPPDMTLTDMFKSVGNGVPFLLANAVAKTIIDFISK